MQILRRLLCQQFELVMEADAVGEDHTDWNSGLQGIE